MGCLHDPANVQVVGTSMVIRKSKHPAGLMKPHLPWLKCRRA